MAVLTGNTEPSGAFGDLSAAESSPPRTSLLRTGDAGTAPDEMMLVTRLHVPFLLLQNQAKTAAAVRKKEVLLLSR